MALLVRSCPNLACKYSGRSYERFYSFKGTFLSKWNNHQVPRYKCRGCGKSFCANTHRATYRQKKPYLNKPVFELYASGTSQRRLARVLGTDRKTIARKFLWAARWAGKRHEEELSRFGPINHVQFDEMESFEHTRLKPLSIPLAVDADSHRIIDIQVGRLNYKGRLAGFAHAKYGPRIDTSERALLKVLASVKKTSAPDVTITTDAKMGYRKLVQKVLPAASHVPVKSERLSMAQRLFRKGRRNENDPLFVLNFTAAKIRHDLSRMARKVWVTTKKPEFLQAHLALYIAYSNGYRLPR